MRLKLSLPVLFCFSLLMAATTMQAHAQQANASVVASCGSVTYVAGRSYPQTQDTTGRLCGAAGGTGSSTVVTQPTASNLNAQVVGNSAAGATDSGNPVKVGCVFITALPTLTTGQRGDVQCTSNNLLQTAIAGATGLDAVVGVPSDGTASNAASNSLTVRANGSLFNGTTWDRQFTCTQSATVNVTAASTTQIIALSGSTVVRICSFSIAMSAAGTASITSGTGSNCGTGTVALTPAVPLATGTPWTVSSGGGSVLRGAAGFAICVAAATGNAVGFITYAQY